MKDQELTEKFHALVSKFKTAMLTTLSTGEGFHARPMEIAGVDENCDLWFFSSIDAPKILEIESHQEILVTCQSDHSSYVALYGTAGLVRTRDKISTYWNESFKVWFPQGKDDPNLVLIHFRTSRGEYWDNSGVSKIKYLTEAAKAYLTGTQPHIDEGIHATARL